jgi:galactose oxidase
MTTRRSPMHMEMPTKAAQVPYAAVLTPHGWTVSATSTAAGRSARAVVGSLASAYWQSARLGGDVRLPQSVTVALPRPTVVSGLSYVPHGGRDVIGRFVVRLSSDGRHFGKPVAYGRWQANPNLKRVGWVPRVVRAVRLTVLSLSTPGSKAVAISRLVLSGALRNQAVPTRKAAPKRDALAAQTASATSTSPSLVGQWGPTIGFPLVPVAVALIPGDKLLVWSADTDLNFNSNNTSQYTQTAILNLATGAVSPDTVSNTAHDMFCPGVSILPNGDVVVTGGIGNTDTSIYHPATNSWTAAAHMNIGRGYQGQTTLSDGQVFTLGGSWSGALGGKLGEVWSPTANWRELTGVPANPIYTADAQGVYRADNHGWFIAASGGRVFQAGPSAQMHWITTTGAGTITAAGARGTSGDEMNGNAILYDINKIFTVGGSPSYQDSNATNVANIVNIGGSTPTVTPTASMTYSRAFANSVVLPTGQIFTVGGQTYAVPFSDATSDLTPEMWSPTTGQWTAMAQEAEPRNYHSVAVLLPDGTVFSGGGGLCGSCATNHPDGQIWSPPYLFNADGSLATRPTIASAPTSTQTGQTISVTTGAPVSSFVMIRYGEATHSVDNDQRRIPLSIQSSSGNTYTLSIPSDPGVALPGPYMLFAINASGTPSVAATVMVSTPAVGTPSSAYGQAVNTAGPALNWPLSDATGSPSAADVSGNRDSGTYSTTGVTYQTPSPVEGATGSGITLNGGQVVSTQPQQTPTSYSEQLWFKTSSTSGGQLATYSNGKNQDRLVYMTTGGNLDFGVYTGKTVAIQSPGAYNDGNWHFVVATQGSDGMHLYVDGQQVASGPTTTAQSYLGSWQLGGVANTGWPNRTAAAFSGSLSDAALFTSELTAAQVQTEYQSSATVTAPPPPPPPPPPPTYTGRIVADGPWAYWPLSDATGSSTAADLSGKNDSGTYSTSGVSYQTPSPVEGATGSGITLSGGQVVSTKTQQAPTSYSEELWVKTTSTAGGVLATFAGTKTAQDRLVYMTSSGQLEFGVYTGKTVAIESPAAYNDGNWHFVVATQGSDGMHLYVDGQPVASGATTTAQAYVASWQLGGVANTGWPNRTAAAFSGSLSDAAVFTSDLTAAQVQAEYQSSPAAGG